MIHKKGEMIVDSKYESDTLQKRAKVEDILKYMADNRTVYEKLKNTDFVPFIGAGLSAGIGVGSWDKLICTVANEFFGRKYSENLDLQKIVIDLIAEDEKIVNKCFLELGNLDKKEKVDSKQIQDCVKQRIDIIQRFLNELEEGGNKQADMQYKLVQKLMSSKRNYAAYEIAELLDQIDDRGGEIYKILKEEINRDRPQQGKWQIDVNKAVYWIPIIIQKKKLEYVAYNCITTNFDSIINDASNFEGLRIGYLHGNIDFAEKGICFTLTDLLNNYRDLLNENIAQRNGIVTDISRGNLKRTFYLFLGTSFSEGHIGRVMGSLGAGSENYAILATERQPDRNELFKIQERVKKFGIGNHNLLFYEIRLGRHDALVDLLHQLSRDVSKGIWNNWNILDNIYLADQDFPNEFRLFENGKKAIMWLEKIDNDNGLLKTLTIKIDGVDSFLLQHNGYEGILECKDKQDMCLFYLVVKEMFKNPNWSLCFLQFDAKGSLENYWQTDIFPIGNTLYFIIDMGEYESKVFKEFNDRIRREIEQGEYESLDCRIIRVIFDSGGQGDILIKYVENLMKIRENNGVEDHLISMLLHKFSLQGGVKEFLNLIGYLQCQHLYELNEKYTLENEIQDDESRRRKI